MMTDSSRALLWPGPVPPVEVRRLLVAVTGLFGATSIVLTLATGEGAAAKLVTVVASLASIALALWLARAYDTSLSTSALLVVLLAALALLVVAFGVSSQPITVLATGLPFAFAIAWHRPAWLSILAALIAIGVSIMLEVGQPADASPVREAVMMTVLLGAATIGFAGGHVGWHLQRQLDQHDADQRDLALTRERLRFATDLHDIQGHTLLAIKLKAELARRSIDHAAAAARAELQEIETLAAEADRRTRDLAHGYRILNVAAECANVERLLDAAGIEVTVHRTGAPPPELDQTFATLIREAASNILRHTNAATVRIHVDETSVVIENDGAASVNAVSPGGGSGLTGLRRRFTAHGGTVAWQHHGDRFILSGEIGARP